MLILKNEELNKEVYSLQTFGLMKVWVPMYFKICVLIQTGLLISSVFGTGSYKYGSAYCHKKNCTYKDGVNDPAATAVGSFNDTLLETGWGILDIVSGWGQNKCDDFDIMYGAGFLEGVLTSQRIFMNYQNMKDLMDNSSPKQIRKLRDYFKDQDAWMRRMVLKHSKADPLWNHVRLILAQFDGLVDGYRSTNRNLDVFAFQYLNALGDFNDLMRSFNPRSIPDWRKMSRDEIKSLVQKQSMCSVLIKVLGGYEDVFMGHSTWFVYQNTMRIYKHYNFNVQTIGSSAKQISFSSYPGCLVSIDDFYLLGSNMVMLQTTNSIFNSSLYNYIKPQSLLAWQRVRLANMMAGSGKEWAKVFAQYNSGTYNNQYMIVDLKKIHLRKTIMDGALWVIEQIPTRVTAGDQTKILRAGYWASYNVPFFADIYNLSGYPAVVSKDGVDFSYQLAPRAKIFRRDEGNVVNLDKMKKIMRYNDYKHDKYSEKDPCDAICCRGDLKGNEAFGGYDTKVTDYKMASKLTADIVNGPTLGSGLPPFQWSSKFKRFLRWTTSEIQLRLY